MNAVERFMANEARRSRMQVRLVVAGLILSFAPLILLGGVTPDQVNACVKAQNYTVSAAWCKQELSR